MSKADSHDGNGIKIIARNRRARHEYEILERWEAGLVLRGTEVKSLRAGKANLQDAFARFHDGELYLHNLHISPYESGNQFNHDPVRTRKLLLRSGELRKLFGQVELKGLTLVPLDLYFKNGVAKATLALVRGKKLHDKRETLKRKTMQREMERGYKGG